MKKNNQQYRTAVKETLQIKTLAFAMLLLIISSTTTLALMPQTNVNELCQPRRVLQQFNGSEILSDRSRFWVNGASSFAGKNVSNCTWTPELSEASKSCIVRFNQRYNNMINVFRESRSPRLEEYILELGDFVGALSLLTLKYEISGDSLKGIDVSIQSPVSSNLAKNFRELQALDPQSQVNWYKQKIRENTQQIQRLCAVSKSSDLEFKSYVDGNR